MANSLKKGCIMNFKDFCETFFEFGSPEEYGPMIRCISAYLEKLPVTNLVALEKGKLSMKLLSVVDKCEVCGQAATVFIRDMKEVPMGPNDKEYSKFEPYGNFHPFCEEHKRDSKTVL